MRGHVAFFDRPYSITKDYGQWYTVAGRSGYHTGIDLATPIGTPIRCPVQLNGSEITHVEYSDTGYGNHMIVTTPSLDEILIGHCATIAVMPHDMIHTGDLLGFTGDTGYSTGPHVHVEYRVGGLPVDPRIGNQRLSPGTFSATDVHDVKAPPGFEIVAGLKSLDESLRRYVSAAIRPGDIKETVINPDMATLDSRGTILAEQLAFSAHSIIVDNPTGKWLLFTHASRYVAPYTFGVIMSIPTGSQVAEVIQQKPLGMKQYPNVAGEVAVAIWCEAFLYPNPGISVRDLAAGTPV